MRIRNFVSMVAVVVTMIAATIVPALAGLGSEEVVEHPTPNVVIDTGLVEVDGGKIAISAYAITLDEAGE